tara:strand:- start:14633 stop:15208 length:576 start_codon:yes stop_codon:yes gene_type:complete
MDKHGSDKKAVIAIDLDGTLAEYHGWKGIEYIGNPVKPVVERLMALHNNGFKVVIFTARANDLAAIPHIEMWLAMNGLPRLDITNIKRKEFVEIWDDRAVSVQRNTGFMMNANDKRKPAKPSQSALDSQIGGGHYKDMKIQPVEFCHANKMGGIESALIKYICRHRAKNGVQDIDKAIHLLQLLKQLEYSA